MAQHRWLWQHVNYHFGITRPTKCRRRKQNGIKNRKNTPIHLLLWSAWFLEEKPYCFHRVDEDWLIFLIFQNVIEPASTGWPSIGNHLIQKNIFQLVLNELHVVLEKCEPILSIWYKKRKRKKDWISTTHESPTWAMKSFSFPISITVAVEPDSTSSPLSSSLYKMKQHLNLQYNNIEYTIILNLYAC